MASSGWNRPSTANQPRKAPKKPSAMRGISAGLVAVAVVAAGFFFLFSGDSGKVEIKKSEKKPTRIAEVTPAAAPKAEAATTNAVAAAKPDRKSLYKYEKAPDGRLRRVNPDGSKTIIIPRGDPPKSIFNYKTERTLAPFIDPGEDIPPMGDDAPDDSDIALALATKLEIKEDDTAEDIRVKEGVERLKDEMREALKQGMTAQEFLREIRLRQARGAMLAKETRNQVIGAIREGRTEEAREMFEAFNKHLEEQGLRKMVFNKRLMNQMGLKKEDVK